MSDQSRQKATVYVGGLDNNVNENTLYDAFIPFGEVVDVSIPKPDLKSSKDPHRGFGYVEFSEAEDANEAIGNMDQSELFGRVIKCNQARPQKDVNEGLGSRTAVWEQEGYAAKYKTDENYGDPGRDGESDRRAGDAMQGLEGLDVAGPQLK